jgi:hypothetical protein
LDGILALVVISQIFIQNFLTFLLTGRFTLSRGSAHDPTHQGRTHVVRVEQLLYFDECPNWKTANGHLRALHSARRWILEHLGTFIISLDDALELARRQTDRTFGRALA